MHDDLRAELAYLSLRTKELRQELQEAEAAFGAPVTESTVGEVLAGVLEALRRSGNEALADKYASAFERFQVANAAVANVNRIGEVNESARAAMNDAQEDFDRVSAAVRAWFDAV
jgi:hypothetical protein